jgi:3-oxoacyl-[acyl-carrier-protein] synthase-3
VQRYGNTSAASIPVALCEAVDEGLVPDGSTLVMSGFGAGLSWGTAVWKWQG